MAQVSDEETLIPKYGGYRKLASFQYAEVIYDVTVRFCDTYIGTRSRTHDQMVQAARSGKQNIAEGSMASGTSKKMELTLTNVARASLEELRLDYEDYIRTNDLQFYEPSHPALMRFKKLGKKNLEVVRHWVKDELELLQKSGQGPVAGTRGRDGSSTKDDLPLAGRVRSKKDLVTAELTANAALSMLNICCMFLDKQIATQAKAFEEEGGFSERLYRVRNSKRKKGK